MSLFDGQTIMITGAGGALARGVVNKFAQEGAQLVMVDIDRDAMENVAERQGDILSDYLIVTGDLGKPEDVDAIVTQAEDKFGTIDALAHVAGGFAMGDPVHATDISIYEKMMYLNARLSWVTMGRVARHMVENGVQGSITTMIAKAAASGAANMAAYSASKAAVEHIMQSMALELKAHGIRVNGISPSVADTPANRAAMPDADWSKWVTADQLAETFAFLASPAAVAITGQNIGVYNRT